MNYGFGPETPGWNPSKVSELVAALHRVVDEVTSHPDDKPAEGSGPFIEADDRGVRIRRITHLPHETKVLLIGEADRTFARVMGVAKR